MIARLALYVLSAFAMFGGCHLFSAEPAMLWDPAVPLPHAIDMPVIAGTRFAVIKPYEFEQDGYRFLHGVGIAWHKNRLYASFGHNKGAENTGSEEARGRVSDDGGRTWGETFTIDSGDEPDLAVSHGVFLSQGGRLHAFMWAYYGTMERVHTRAYMLDEATGQWAPLGESTIALGPPGESTFSRALVIRRSEHDGEAESHPGAQLSYPYAIEHDGQLYVGYSNSGGGVGRVGEGRQLWNNNSGELAVIPVATLRAD